MSKPYAVMENKESDHPIVVMEVPEDPMDDRVYLSFTADEAWELVIDLCVAIDAQRKREAE